jgi:hypothetical protein
VNRWGAQIALTLGYVLTNYIGTNKLTTNFFFIIQEILKDVFDEDDLADTYRGKMWSELDDDMKEDLIEAVENNLVACDLQVPSEGIIERRVKGYYNNKRTTELTKADSEKRKKTQSGIG